MDPAARAYADQLQALVATEHPDGCFHIGNCPNHNQNCEVVRVNVAAGTYKQIFMFYKARSGTKNRSQLQLGAIRSVADTLLSVEQFSKRREIVSILEEIREKLQQIPAPLTEPVLRLTKSQRKNINKRVGKRLAKRRHERNLDRLLDGKVVSIPYHTRYPLAVMKAVNECGWPSLPNEVPRRASSTKACITGDTSDDAESDDADSEAMGA